MSWPTIFGRKTSFFVAAATACVAAMPVGAATGHAAAHPPAGLNRDDWNQIRRALGGALPPYVREASLFGHGDPYGEPYSWAGAAVSVSGDTAVVGAHHESGPAGYVGAAHVFVRSGGVWTEQQRVLAPDGHDNQVDPDAFGAAVSVSGDTLVVGAPYHAETYNPTGAVYVYVRAGGVWSFTQELFASDAEYHSYFGGSVSISGDTLVVGAPQTQEQYDAGAAYVFARAGSVWGEQQKLAPADSAFEDRFGGSVSISGDTLVVGARLADTAAGADTGAAYVFFRTGILWMEQQKLLPSDAASQAEFGNAVAIDGDTAVVGAHLADTPGGPDAGAAYVFARSGAFWGEQQKLLPSDAAPSLGFGDSASISGDTVAVGAVAASGNQGAAYVFVRTGVAWSEEQKLSASDAAPGASFGWSVSASGDSVVVGAPRAGVAEAGQSYVFLRTAGAWAEEQKLAVMGNAAWDNFGAAALDGDTLVVGDFADDTAAGVTAGSAYVFVRSNSTWSEQQKLVRADGAQDDGFGISVGISGDTLVVGSIHADAAYVYVRSGGVWTEQQKLVPPNGPGGWFGWAVAISGDTLAVTQPVLSMAYVYVRSGTTWNLEQEFPALGGGAVALSGDTLALTEYLFPGPSPVHVFVRSGTIWSEQQELVNNDGNSQFGGPFALSADSLAVGGGEFVYVFVRSGGTWTEQQRLGFIVQGDGFGGGLALAGDMLIVGASTGGAPVPPGPGAVYVFLRSRGVWAQQQEILPPDPGVWGFGSVALSGDTIAVGAPYTSTPDWPLAGSVQVYRIEQADVSIAKTDGQDTAVPGEAVSYTITLGNFGPTLATEVAVSDTVPAILEDPSWTCAASPGSACGASAGSGNLQDLATVLVGGSVAYTLTATIDPDATGTLTNTAAVSTFPGVDANPVNDAATDVDTLTPEGDVFVTNTDDSGIAIPGGMVAYTVIAANAGPSTLVAAHVDDLAPAGLLWSAWGCSASAGSSCGTAGSGGISDSVTLRPGGTATYTFWGGVDTAATGSLVNTASIGPPAGVPDPDMTNNSDSDVDTLLPGISVASELIHGYRRRHVLAPSVAPTDLFRIRQRRHASYEVLLDAASGDLGSGAGPFLERVASDAATPVQDSTPIGPGGGRSLRWMNGLDTPVADEFIRVRSDACTTDCDGADAYWIGALETTGLIPRFNNSGTQTTLLVLQNLGDEALDVDVRFWSPSGADLGGPPTLNLGPKASFLLDTSTVALGTGGSITVANTGRYGLLAGKAVALEPATGFTFDTMLQLRSR